MPPTSTKPDDQRLPPREIRTERLVLRCWREDDAAEMRRVLDLCDAHLRPWLPFMQHEPRTLLQTRQVLAEARTNFESGDHFRYAIREPVSEALLGETMLIRRGGPNTLEAGYWLHQDHCGRGYATEATRALLLIAFDTLAVGRVILRCDQRNAASVHVAERLGAVHIATESVEEHGEPVRLLVFERKRPG